MMTGKKNVKAEPNQEVTEDVKKVNIDYQNMTCGYVMPIASNPNYKLNHWNDVVKILDEVCEDIGFKVYKLVSNTLESNVIHASIVNNLFNDEMVICDVSSKNPNVMFELGMRIAFDKPVIIIKDESTDYCFDTGTIEHINYPKELRYEDIKSFKIKLKNKIIATLKSKHEFPDKSPILERFGLIASRVSLANLPNMDSNDIFKADVLGAISILNRKVDSLVNKKIYDSDIFVQKKGNNKPYVYSVSIDIDDMRKASDDYKEMKLTDLIEHFINTFSSDIKNWFIDFDKNNFVNINFKSLSEYNKFINILVLNHIDFIPF